MNKVNKNAKNRIKTLRKFDGKNEKLISFLLDTNVAGCHSVELKRLESLIKTPGGAIQLNSPYQDAVNVAKQLQEDWLTFSRLYPSWKNAVLQNQIGQENFETTLRVLENCLANLKHARKGLKETLARHYLQFVDNIHGQSSSKELGRFKGSLSTCMTSKVKDTLSFDEVVRARAIVYEALRAKAA